MLVILFLVACSGKVSCTMCRVGEFIHLKWKRYDELMHSLLLLLHLCVSVCCLLNIFKHFMFLCFSDNYILLANHFSIVHDKIKKRTYKSFNFSLIVLIFLTTCLTFLQS